MMSAPAPVAKQAVINHRHFVEKTSKDMSPNTLAAATMLPTNRNDARAQAMDGRNNDFDSTYIRCAKKACV